MNEKQLNELRDILASLPARPKSYSYEGTVRPSRKSEGYAGHHVHSVCGGPDKDTDTEKHHCIGKVLAPDEETAKSLAHLVETTPLLLDEVDRLRAVLGSLSDENFVERLIEECENCGGDGVRCAAKTVRSIARDALKGRGNDLSDRG